MSQPPFPTGDDARLKSGILGVLTTLPLVLWLVFIVAAIAAPHGANQSATMNDTIRLVGIGSGTALATIAGGFLGVEPQTRFFVRVRAPRFSLAGWATLAYFGGLVVAALAWAIDPHREMAAEVVRTALVTIFGFGLGALKAATSPKT